MHKFNAHAATDVTGFGILGHAKNLVENQNNDVCFHIHTLPIIANMTKVYKACGINFKLFDGFSAETSGIYFEWYIINTRNIVQLILICTTDWNVLKTATYVGKCFQINVRNKKINKSAFI